MAPTQAEKVHALVRQELSLLDQQIRSTTDAYLKDSEAAAAVLAELTFKSSQGINTRQQQMVAETLLYQTQKEFERFVRWAVGERWNCYFRAKAKVVALSREPGSATAA